MCCCPSPRTLLFCGLIWFVVLAALTPALLYRLYAYAAQQAADSSAGVILQKMASEYAPVASTALEKITKYM